ncbi:phage/plasmid primase, P4 family [Kribbella sp. NPDC056345]|uniref:phage/plasmid primase, P4 family n=1 Tax=Kribbella sp. NPDC056345 TaxID=3345789 RepID=UPI0035DDF8B8
MDPFSDPTPVATGLTLAAFLGQLDGVDAEGDGYLTLCPAHEDSDPSLRVAYNPERKTVMAHCRAGCETTDVLAAMGLRMSDLFNVEIGDLDDVRLTGTEEAPVSVGHRAALAQYVRTTADALSDEAAAYAARRFGITRERAVSLRLGFDGGTGRLPIQKQNKRINGLSRALYRDAPRLTVPMYDFAGHAHYLQARAITDPYTGAAKWSGPANPDKEVWGRYGWFPGDTGWLEVVVTEGPGDGLTSVGLGYDTLLIRGAGLGDSAELAQALAAIRPDARVILAGDNDKAGSKFNARVGQRMTDAGLPVFVLQLPEAADDLTHWRELDPAAFPQAFARAVRSANPWVPLPPETPNFPNTPRRPSPAEDSLPHTELANAQRLVARMGGLLRHTPALGFLVWNGSAWAVDNRSRVRQAAQQSAIALMEEAKAMPSGEPGSPEDKRQRAAFRWAHDSQRSRGIEAVMKEVQALPNVAVSPADLDAKPDLLACRNGTVNLRTGELKAADPADLLTKALDIDYDAAATAPRWEQFLSECFPDETDMTSYLRRLVGYGITGHATEQCYVMLHGRGGNGKSVFTSALYDVFGNITASVGIETFLAAANQNDGSAASSDVASLRSSRLVLTSEAEAGARMAEAKLKRLTGGDPITARFLYREPFTFMPSFLLFMSTNAVPEVRDNSDGIWRRVKIIEWRQQFTGARKDTRLSAKLRAEAPGILAWAVQGAVEWYATGGLGEPASVTETVEAHRAEADKLLEFFPGAIVNDSDGWISRAELYAAYREWCEAEGHSRPWQNTTLYQELANRGVDQSKRKGVRGFKGVRKARPTDSEEGRAQAAALTQLPAATPSQAPSLDFLDPIA